MIRHLSSAARLAVSFVLGLAALPVAQGDPAPAPPAVTTGDTLAEALPILQSKYVNFAALQLKRTDRLYDLINRSQGEISLAAPSSLGTPPPILTASLPGNILYLRLSSFLPATGWPDFTTQLDQAAGQGIQGVILDLRSNSAPDDLDGAAQVAGYFLPPGKPLFTVTDAQRNSHLYTSTAPPSAPNPALEGVPVAVLTDHQTSGAAEALAEALKANGALVLGAPTMGRGAVFGEQKLSTGQVLRFVTGQIVMTDGTALWDHPVSPDIALSVDPTEEGNALSLIGENKVADVVREATQRHRMSEAALVKGEDPEIDSYLLPHDKFSPPPLENQDVVLVNAIDSLLAIRLSERPPVAPESVEAVPGEAAVAQ